MGHQHGFVVPEVAICQTEHQQAAQRVHFLARLWLRHASEVVAIVAQQNVLGYLDDVRSGEGRILGIGKVNMKIEFLQLIREVAKFDVMIGAPRGGSRAPSRSEGRKPKLALSGGMQIIEAGAPASIAGRSKAQGSAPRKAVWL